MITANTLVATIDRRKRRYGRGVSSGKGKTCGRGMKGQKARAMVRAGFEGGQARLIKRLRMIRGQGNPPVGTKEVGVNLSQLEQFFAEKEKVTMFALRKKGLIKSGVGQVKILGRGKLTKKLVFADSAVRFSKKVAEILRVS